MTHFNDMTAAARVARSRAAMPVRQDAPWVGFASLGQEQQCGRSLASGGAR